MSKSIIMQLLLRGVAVFFLGIFLFRIYEYAQYQQLTLNIWLLAIGEIITIFLVVFARLAKTMKVDVITALSTAVASFYFLFIDFGSGIKIAPDMLTYCLQFFAILFQIYAKICLGFSFGLLPANRGVVTKGAYKIIRHPIYFGYFLNHIGFLLSGFSVWNIAILLALYFFQGVRIWQEEKLLSQDETYKHYMTKTKYRFIPFLF